MKYLFNQQDGHLSWQEAGNVFLIPIILWFIVTVRLSARELLAAQFLNKLSDEKIMAEVTANNFWFLAVALVFLPLRGKNGVATSVSSDCKS